MAATDFKVFYSWQSDLPAESHKDYIHDALTSAIGTLNCDIGPSLKIILDQDTQGVPGAAPISDRILEKISDCQAFVADVSIANAGFVSPSGRDLKRSPNPNVLLELGYALHRLGWQNCLLVINAETGDPQQLPFDLKHRKAVAYSVAPGTGERSLTENFIDELRMMVGAWQSANPVVPEETPMQVLIHAIENQEATRKEKVRNYWRWLDKEIGALSPGASADPSFLQTQIYASIEIVANFEKVASSIAVCGDQDAATELYRSFQSHIAMEEPYTGQPRINYPLGQTYLSFVMQELFVSFFAALIAENQWGVIEYVLNVRLGHRTPSGELKSLRFPWPGFGGTDTILEEMPQSPSQVIFGQHHAGQTIRLKPLRNYIEADFLLSLVAAKQNENESQAKWFGLSLRLLRDFPSFLSSADEEGFAKALFRITGARNATELRSRVFERLAEAANLQELLSDSTSGALTIARVKEWTDNWKIWGMRKPRIEFL